MSAAFERVEMEKRAAIVILAWSVHCFSSSGLSYKAQILLSVQLLVVITNEDAPAICYGCILGEL